MKLIITSILSIILLNSNSLYSQTWPQYYGQTNRRDRAWDIIETYDKGYLILGNYPGFSWLIKTDINGNVLWEKIIDNEPNPLGTSLSIEPANDGGILVCGIAFSVYSEKYCPFVMKLNACGDKIWCKIFEGSPNTYPSALDVKETDSGDIVLLVFQYGKIPQETIHLFKLTANGEMLWKESFATTYNYPGSNTKQGRSIVINSEGDYLISGNGYWEQPWNPGGPMPLTPLFILASSDGNEEWVLPFGLNDTIIGAAYHSLEFSNNAYLGSGYNWPVSNKIEPIFLIFNSLGDELSYSVIKPDSINSLLSEGAFEISQLTEAGVFSGGTFVQKNSQLEIIVDCMLSFDTNTLMLQPSNHKLNFNGRFPYINTVSYDNKLLSSTTFYHSSTNYDIFLAKLNLNLEYDTAYSGNFTYDSLCIPGPPQSGFIYLNDCDIVLGTEMPTAAEYRARVSTIPIIIYPNPAKDYITFALENTEHHRNIELRCFNLLGMQQQQTKILRGQKQASAKVSAWPPGMYIAVVLSDGKPVGRGKFVVQR